MDEEQTRYANLLFGEIAVRLGFCTEDEIDKVVRLQQQANQIGRQFFFGDLLYKQGVLTEEQVKKILAEQKFEMEQQEELLFGRIAITNTGVTEDDVKGALEEQKKLHAEGSEFPPIGEILVKQGKLSDQEREALLKTQKRLRDPKSWVDGDIHSRPKEH